MTHIEPWTGDDLALLQRLLGDPAMMSHLGGAEDPDRIAERHAEYAETGSRQFRIVDGSGALVGWVGYWERDWRDEPIFEIGWSVLPEAQGRGSATEATAQAVALARDERRLRFVHAFPSVDNTPSNAICRKVGFTLRERCSFEYPTGTFMQVNDWALDLFADPVKRRGRGYSM
jgi:RimJ/RimL family protein N-acetyltransferase